MSSVLGPTPQHRSDAFLTGVASPATMPHSIASQRKQSVLGKIKVGPWRKHRNWYSLQESSFQWCGLSCRQGGGTVADIGKLSLTANQLQNSLHQLTTLTKQGSASRCSREPRNMTIFSCRHVDPPASHRRRKVKTSRKMLPTESRAAAEEEKP
ncbi:hypothetical protein F2Q70_00014177 [Brassica cretica]|uniref:Uncharacterized protein n=1 Tax=Brassica cretica TaxID=69181 RepID=A0A8S9I0J0_BRACR|nr:hypothetical protein F2Q70_00014177 [Brassica cretica]